MSAVVTLVRLELHCDGPWAVAAPELQTEVDRPLARDPFGAVVVPGTSVAGSLRDHLTRRDPAMALALMGPAKAAPGARGGDDGAVPGVMRLLGVRVQLDEEPETVLRTAIDRRRGAAAEATLRSAEQAGGATVVVYLRADRLLDDGERRAIGSWQPRLGGARSTGRGRFALVGATCGALDLLDTADLRRWLGMGGAELFDAVATEPLVAEDVDAIGEQVIRRYELRIVDGLHLGGRSEGNRRLVRRRGDRLVVDGSSLKGVFRSRAEYLSRSLGVAACEGADVTGACLLNTCPVCQVFGNRERRGAVAFGDATIEGDGPGRQARVVRRAHVAVDRISGGAHDSLLFEDEVVAEGRLVVTVHELGPVPEHAVRLLDAVVLDLHDGLVGIGAGTTRGYGTVALVGDPPDVEGKLSDALRAAAGSQGFVRGEAGR